MVPGFTVRQALLDALQRLREFLKTRKCRAKWAMKE
jgi:hypothetical protein